MQTIEAQKRRIETVLSSTGHFLLSISGRRKELADTKLAGIAAS